MKQAMSAARWAILLILFSAVLGWILFEIAIFVDVLVDTSAAALNPDSADSLYGLEAVQVFRPSKYILFAAIAVFAVGALMAQKSLLRLRVNSGDSISLAKAGHEFANTALIISLAIAAWAALAVFLDSFFATSNADVNVSLRLLNTYLPIVLYTVLVVTVILTAFVFRARRVPSPATQTELPSQVEDEPRGAQRNVGLSFAIPIVAVAIALIFGLIVFDLTQTAIQVWIWVIIQSVIAAGIISGTVLAQRAITSFRNVPAKPSGASIGAKNLNFVLSVIFAAVLSLMSLGYGVSAIEQLRVSPGLTLSVYSNQAKVAPMPSDGLILDELFIMVNGTDLQRNSAVSVTISDAHSASEVDVIAESADRDGNFWAEEPFDTSLEAGEYVLSLNAVSADGSILERSLPFIVTEERTSTWPDGVDTYSQDPQGTKVLPISLSWVLSDLLPALLLLILAATVIYRTLRTRNLPHDQAAS